MSDLLVRDNDTPLGLPVAVLDRRSFPVGKRFVVEVWDKLD